MAEFHNEKRVVVCSDAVELAESVATRFLRRIGKRIAQGETAHVALAGGAIAGSVLSEAAVLAPRHGLEWSRVHFWWGDECFVPRASELRNDRAAEALLRAIPVPSGNVHRIAAPDDGISIGEAADAYAAELARFGDTERAWPAFDVCFLGVGADAHVASLFPDRPEIQVTDRTAVAMTDAPKPPAARITLTRPVLNSSRRMWLVVSGEDKAAALGLALAGASYDQVPAAGAKGRKRTVFFVDEAAASQVPPELIDPDY